MSEAEIHRLQRNLDELNMLYRHTRNRNIAERRRLTDLALRLAESNDVGHWQIAEQIREAITGEGGSPDG